MSLTRGVNQCGINLLLNCGKSYLLVIFGLLWIFEKILPQLACQAKLATSQAISQRNIRLPSKAATPPEWRRSSGMNSVCFLEL